MPTNKQIVQGAYQAFAEGDVPQVLALMDDKIEWTEAEGFPLHGTYVGPQAVVEGVFMRLGEIGDEFTVTPTLFVAEDDTVVAIGTYSWKHCSTGKPAIVQDHLDAAACRYAQSAGAVRLIGGAPPGFGPTCPSWPSRRRSVTVHHLDRLRCVRTYWVMRALDPVGSDGRWTPCSDHRDRGGCISGW